MKESDYYLKIVEWSEEDQCYIGYCPGLFLGGCHGDDESDVYKELCRIVEENIALYKEDAKTLPPSTAGKAYSGKFFLNVGKDLHKLLSIKALQAGKSFNNYCVNLLQQPFQQSKQIQSSKRISQPVAL